MKFVIFVILFAGICLCIASPSQVVAVIGAVVDVQFDVDLPLIE